MKTDKQTKKVLQVNQCVRDEDKQVLWRDKTTVLSNKMR